VRQFRPTAHLCRRAWHPIRESAVERPERHVENFDASAVPGSQTLIAGFRSGLVLSSPDLMRQPGKNAIGRHFTILARRPWRRLVRARPSLYPYRTSSWSLSARANPFRSLMNAGVDLILPSSLAAPVDGAGRNRVSRAPTSTPCFANLSVTTAPLRSFVVCLPHACPRKIEFLLDKYGFPIQHCFPTQRRLRCRCECNHPSSDWLRVNFLAANAIRTSSAPAHAGSAYCLLKVPPPCPKHG